MHIYNIYIYIYIYMYVYLFRKSFYYTEFCEKSFTNVNV